MPRPRALSPGPVPATRQASGPLGASMGRTPGPSPARHHLSLLVDGRPVPRACGHRIPVGHPSPPHGPCPQAASPLTPLSLSLAANSSLLGGGGGEWNFLSRAGGGSLGDLSGPLLPSCPCFSAWPLSLETSRRPGSATAGHPGQAQLRAQASALRQGLASGTTAPLPSGLGPLCDGEMPSPPCTGDPGGSAARTRSREVRGALPTAGPQGAGHSLLPMSTRKQGLWPAGGQRSGWALGQGWGPRSQVHGARGHLRPPWLRPTSAHRLHSPGRHGPTGPGPPSGQARDDWRAGGQGLMRRRINPGAVYGSGGGAQARF